MNLRALTYAEHEAAARDLPILSVSFAMHECRRYLKLARRPPKGYRLRALERQREATTARLKAEVGR